MATPQNKNHTSSSYKESGLISTPTKVRVIVRVRPFLSHEKFISSNSCVLSSSSPLENQEEVTVQLKDPYSSRQENYKVDSFYGQESDSNNNNVKEIFEREVMPLIPSVVLNGYKATVFAYGATASGKTFTMQGSDEVPGLMPMATSAILSMCENTAKTVEISYYEIYMERCYDLLEVKASEIAILDDGDGHPHLFGLAKIPIYSMVDFQEIFVRGTQRRKVAHTGLNDVSSRSHGVLVISVSHGPGSTLIGKLNLIDLAGNEDNRKSGNVGVQLHESTKINQSLFALSQVIHALNNNNNARIPYRDSKLTRILQDSLGGTSLALMVACLNPGEYEQSVHTVSLAARSRRISYFVHSAQKHNTPKSHVDMEAKLRAWLESKGKTKSAQRQDVTLTRTPCSIRSSKKFNTVQHSEKTNSIRTSEQHAQRIETSTTSMSKKMKRCTRKVLSPINNVNIDQRTPKRQSVADDTTQITTDTPLNKFKALSCNLKSTLAQEYVYFLNAADKVELQQLKGIGEKMADYILELRDTSPLKSLNDLEKIGLSSKQVDNMFGRTAKGLFD